MNPVPDTPPTIDDELEVLADLIPLDKRDFIELGCGAAQLARSLLSRFPDSRVTGLEVEDLGEDVRGGDLEVVATLAVTELGVELSGLGVDEVRREVARRSNTKSSSIATTRAAATGRARCSAGRGSRRRDRTRRTARSPPWRSAGSSRA